ncbi:MAG: ABC-F family ATP-binding cassette domain-containing protein [Bacteroidales bacterium]|nr:ABC-F family ATP-binding cassette domain-containing protein [Bacteroidales bacterium]
MISINALTVAFGADVLFDNIGFNLDDGEKVGLAGKNGAGKSTLLKILCGQMAPTSGSVDRPRDIKFGYLPQIMSHNKGRSVMDEVMTAFQERFDLEKKLADATEELTLRTDYESDAYAKLIEKVNSLTDRLAVEESEPPQAGAGRVLRGLGFRDEDFFRNTETFSQGWNMRIELAKILLSKPDVMLLDEPTNHLDIESIEWLEQFLKSYRGAVVLVSHDKRFLDNITTRTLEISLGKLYDYKVPYSKYLELRQERLQQQIAAYQNQQRMIEKTEEFIERFRYKATKANQVQSRIKALDRLDRIEVDETDLSAISFKFPPAVRCGDIVYKAIGLTAGYPGKTVFSGADIEIKRGEKVAFVGRNGEGKTTQLRIIEGELQPVKGESKVGHNVQFGYYAQNQEDILDKTDTVFGTLDRIAVGDIRTRLRDLLAQFLFRGDDIDKRVSVLSGGERARLGMAKLMLGSYNCLLLDEPTNHMDIRSKEMLKKALKAYDGTLIVVSHDRDFLDGLADRLYVFRDGRVKEFPGDVNDFLKALDMSSLSELDRKVQPASQPSVKPETAQQSSQKSYQAMKNENREQKKLKNRIEFLEKETDKISDRMKKIEVVLSAPGEGDDIMELTREYLELKRDLDFKTQEWEKLIESL